jgi:hypothetical protein
MISARRIVIENSGIVPLKNNLGAPALPAKNTPTRWFVCQRHFPGN